MMERIANQWSRHFGLAGVPLFEEGEIAAPDLHSVLLDSGNGSFILSEAEDDPKLRNAASWAWSCFVPHHIAIRREQVIVTRWDKPDLLERFTFDSISEKLDAFYNYLNKDNVAGHDVVATLLDLFRAVRGELQDGDGAVVDTFLDVLARLITKDRPTNAARSDFVHVWAAARDPKTATLGESQLDRLEAGFKRQVSDLLGFDFRGSLAVRHAASAIFQEAHFTFESSPQLDLFGYQSPQSSQPSTRGAHHFTPAPLARSVVEEALGALSDIRARQKLVLCDPACGSGAFLTEAARVLRRIGFNGALHLIGRDTSNSAVAMARFALEAARYDWTPKGGIEIDVTVSDALDPGALPQSDVVVMNPPFVAWPVMNGGLREKVVAILGPLSKHRPDASMAFITRALQAVPSGGVVASLIPTSLLSLDSAEAWRHDLLDRARLVFLGSFGQYGLFVHALVQVSAVVLVAGEAPGVSLVLEAANRANATGDALRALRRSSGTSITGASGNGWRLTPVPQTVLAGRKNWRVLPEPVEREIRRLVEAGVPRVADLFDVKQGILTGLNDAFVLDDEEHRSLPPAEQKFFRPAIFRNAITNGRIEKRFFLFYPYRNGKLIFSGERELQQNVPNYYKQWLADRKAELQGRSGVNQIDRPWWSLSRFYKWADRKSPRILSKYFGASGAFALDENAIFIPVQAHAWFPRSATGSGYAWPAEYGAAISHLTAYCTLLNSRTFSRLLAVFSHRVAGGQFNLSPRFVREIPLPWLGGNEAAQIAKELSDLALASDLMSRTWLDRAEELAMSVWGRDLVEALKELGDV